MTFLELLVFRNIRYRRGAGRGEINVCCPFCGDNRFRLGLNWQRSVGHCFNCDWKSRNAVKEFRRKLALLAYEITDGEPEGATQEEGEERKAVFLPEDFYLLSSVGKEDGLWFMPRSYLRRRRIPTSQMDRHFVGASFLGRFAYRIIFPVHYEKNLLGIVARDWTGRQDPKYLNSSGEKSLYGIRRNRDDRSLILSEGCIKALAIERVAPECRSVAVLGHAVTPLQIDQMRDAKFRKVILYSDPDKAGIKGTISIAEKLVENRFEVSVVYPIPLKQADDYTPEELAETLQHIRPLTANLMLRLKKETL